MKFCVKIEAMKNQAQTCTQKTWSLNFSDDDFIGAGLGGMGYSHRSYEKTIPDCKFLRGRFQTGSLRK